MNADFFSAGLFVFVLPGWGSILSCCCADINTTYKDRAAPPIGGTALHDGGVKTVQWTKREGHDSYQEVEVYIYKYI